MAPGYQTIDRDPQRLRRQRRARDTAERAEQSAAAQLPRRAASASTLIAWRPLPHPIHSGSKMYGAVLDLIYINDRANGCPTPSTRSSSASGRTISGSISAWRFRTMTARGSTSFCKPCPWATARSCFAKRKPRRPATPPTSAARIPGRKRPDRVPETTTATIAGSRRAGDSRAHVLNCRLRSIDRRRLFSAPDNPNS